MAKSQPGKVGLKLIFTFDLLEGPWALSIQPSSYVQHPLLLRRTFLYIYFQIPSTKVVVISRACRIVAIDLCDIDLWTIDLIHTSHWGKYLCQVILKSFQPKTNYSSDKQPLNVTLNSELWTRFMRATCSLTKENKCVKL